MEYASEMNGTEVATIGMAVRFPQSWTLHEFWHNTVRGKECITLFSEGELLAEGAEQSALDNPAYARVKPYIEGIRDFDITLFGYSHREAQILDPKSRVLHEVVYHALEDAGYVQRTSDLITGVFVGASKDVDWLRRSLSQIGGDALNRFESGIYGHKDLLAYLIVYSLNLNGLVYSLCTSCSISLSAMHIARRSLLFGECGLTLAGGITIDLPQKSGYLCQQSMIHSTDGHCRPFDSQASGTLSGDGAGVVVLQRLEDALAAGDRIYAAIRGSAVNNDGKQKTGFVVSGHERQKTVTCTACHLAEISLESIGYVRTHGTGARIGDPTEFAVLTEAFDTSHHQYCVLGAVKANIGHTHTVAGVAGLIKMALVLHHWTIPSLVNYQMPNSKLDLTHSPFYILIQPQEWPAPRMPPRVGVSSFGIGGTSVHMILEGLNPVVCDGHDRVRAPVFIPLSAPSLEQLDEPTQQLTPLLATPDALTLTYTQQVARPVFDCHRVIQVENDGTQAMLASLDNLMPDAPWGLYCPDLCIMNDCTCAQWLVYSAHYQREATALTALLDGINIPPAYCHAETWAAQTNSSLLIRGCQTIVALEAWMNLLPTLTLLSGAGTGPLPVAVASSMIAT